MKYFWIVWLTIIYWSGLSAQVSATRHHLQFEPFGLFRKSDREINLRYQWTLEGGMPFSFSAKFLFPESAPKLAEGTSVQEYTEVIKDGFISFFFVPIFYDEEVSYPGNRP